MNIIIAGCGKIGTTILSNLVLEGHDVVIIDDDANVVSNLSNIYDVIGVCGNCADCNVLSEAGAEKAELFVSVAGSDELNMLACFMARKMGAKHTIARIRNPEYNDDSLMFMRKNLEISMAINPELLTAQEIYNILKFPSAMKIENFSRRNFEMIELRLKEGSVLDGMSLMQMREKYKAAFLVCVVQRNGEVIIPDGNFVLKSGDSIGITAKPTELQRLLRETELLKRQARSVMILGGSTTAYYLAKLLISSGTEVKIIEEDKRRCRELSEKLPKATVILGDGAQQELLLEEGIRSVDAFVALTGIDEENILISFMASSFDVSKIVVKVNREELFPMAGKLGLDSIASPKNIIAGMLVRYARALQNSLGSKVETLYKLMDGDAEALEFIVNNEDPHITQIPLKQLQIKKNILIAGIIRERTPIIPNGDDVIQKDDRVIVIAAGERLNDLSDILK